MEDHLNFFTVLLFLLLSNTSFAFEAIVTQVRGEVYIDSVKASKGDKLVEGQMIEARDKKSFFVMEYTDGTKIMMKDAKIRVGIVSVDKNEIELSNGTLYAKVKPLNDKKMRKFDKLVIKTRTASMGVRGTKFFITEEKDSSYLCVCEGVVEARSLSGKSLLVNKNEDLKIFNIVDELNKTNASKQMIEMGDQVFDTF